MLEYVTVQAIDLMVFDIGLPDIDGMELCKTIRKASAVPILFLSARTDEIDKVVGLEIGGDDYTNRVGSHLNYGSSGLSVL